MIKRSLRSALLGSAAAAMLAASSGAAQAIEFNFGDVTMYVDTTVSAGTSMRVVGTDHRYLPTSNGGPLQAGTTPDPTPAVPVAGGFRALNVLGPDTSLAGSINTDDGRLNFSAGDFTAATLKMTNDILFKYQNYSFFTRINSYYDPLLNSDGAYARSHIGDGAKTDVARDINVLDFYATGQFDVGVPLTVKLGKQVINWGESTFILNGVNANNPIDVNAFRRPGAEVKEGLVPLWAVDAGIELPYGLSLEAWYQLKWEPFKLDRPGTPFATSDVARIGSVDGGNTGARSFLTGGPGGNVLRNCSTPNYINDAFNAAYAGTAPAALAAVRDCAQGGFDFSGYNSITGTGAYPYGNSEAFRFAYGDSSVVRRDEDREARDSGQYGVALRWYSSDLNFTEFGFYFMNYHSRLPIASERVEVNPSNVTYQSYLSVGNASSGTSRALPYLGCNGGSGSDPGATYGAPAGLSAEQIAALNQAGPTDPNGIYAAGLAAADAFYNGTAPANPTLTPAANLLFAGGVEGADLSLLGGNYTGVTVTAGSLLATTIINCALIAQQAAQVAPGTTLATDGTEIVFGADYSRPTLGLYLEYPEDIKMFGFSFNTTVGTWGLQGEMTYRHNQPVQLDTDQITISALNSACTFEQLLGPTAYNALIPFSTGLANPDTLGGSCGAHGTGAQSFDVSGVERTKILTGQLGTTATFTNSNPMVQMTGADLGILVTEFGTMWAPDAPSQVSSASGGKRWGNVCATGGTDLPLGGFLALASREGCRPTEWSGGYVLLGQLQYNNAFGTAWTLNPTIAFRHDVFGNSPAPLSNYRRDSKSVSLQLNAAYQTWKAGLSYTNFFGATKYNSQTDMDYVSFNVSYAF